MLARRSTVCNRCSSFILRSAGWLTYRSGNLSISDPCDHNAFYRAGSLVFGGRHIVLPLLQAATVPGGWVSNETFLAGYGAAVFSANEPAFVIAEMHFSGTNHYHLKLTKLAFSDRGDDGYQGNAGASG